MRIYTAKYNRRWYPGYTCRCCPGQTKREGRVRARREGKKECADARRRKV